MGIVCAVRGVVAAVGAAIGACAVAALAAVAAAALAARPCLATTILAYRARCRSCRPRLFSDNEICI